ncbi:GntR family transcriptional regulator [Inquilinus limosus]|uniref:GntR family transcriptional regulator n=1 Tax=Inquilinus limosus TaxID=171674 RepID=UPI00068D4C1E|nr:GntR family transcriptional regulator [Inquilinus limosus]
MKLQIDRELPVPLGLQVKGLIEYGIACGELSPGERLPSVRELAERLAVAPMTVALVYRGLREAGLIETRHGRGSFVAESGEPRQRPRTEIAEIQRRLDHLIDDAVAIGLTPADLTGMVQARLAQRRPQRRVRSVVMLGLFRDATRAYAAAIQSRLPPGTAVQPLTMDELRGDDVARRRAAEAELVVTFPNRQREAAALLPDSRVIAIRFIPSEETRRALAGLDPLARLGIASRFADFLPIMKSGVQRFAPHVRQVAAAALGTPALDGVIDQSDVVVLSTGAESVLPRLRPGVRAIEYRHSPDPVDVDQQIVPLLSPATKGVAEPQEAVP